MASVDGVVAHLFVAPEQILEFEQFPFAGACGDIAGVHQQMRAGQMRIEEGFSAGDAAGHSARAAARVDMAAGIAGVENSQ